MAIENGDLDIVNDLIKAGADIDQSHALYNAIESGNVDVVDALLKAGANPLLKSERNCTTKDLVNKWINDAETKKKIIRLLEEAEEKQLKQDSNGQEKLVDSDEKHNSPLVSSSASHVEDNNQNEPNFFSKHKWEIGVGVDIALGMGAGITVALMVGATLCFTTNLPVLTIIGIAALSGFIVVSIAFGITYIESKPGTEIEKVAENNLEQHAHAGVQDLPV